MRVALAGSKSLSQLNDLLISIWDWIRDDYKTHPFRFAVEITAWIISIGCSATMAFTVPNPPLLAMYPFWITGCCMYGWAAYTRKSFGMIANYLLLVTIDSIGLFRMLVN